MTKNWIIIALGVFIALLPFLGFPGGWKTFLFVLAGLLVALLSLLMIAREHVAEVEGTPEQKDANNPTMI